MNVEPSPKQHQFPCRQCGGMLTFEPGTDSLKCPYCGAMNQIAASAAPVEELDYNTYLRQSHDSAETVEVSSVKCGACGAESTLPPGTTSGRCPFCGQPIVAQAVSKRQIKPQSLLPFAVKREQAADAFRTWLAGLWFAPGDLVKFADRGKIDGCYVPAWTYDCGTTTAYTGERGEDYYETETYTEVVNGREETRTREVLRTRWWPVSGVVTRAFDDVLVLATDTLPPKCRDHLQPWDLQSLVAYQDDYLSGFVTETYQVDLPNGFERAKGIMQPAIVRTVEQDIGGDHQRIGTLNTSYQHVTFKHILLPMWISAYSMRGQSYRFLVNARTGKVAGERPYSVWKITLLIFAILVLLVVAMLIANHR
jgi:LSD1 subclass zinc finger protein